MPQKTEKREDPGRERSKHEDAGKSAKKRQSFRPNELERCRRIHAEREHNSPQGRLVAELILSDYVSPDHQGDEKGYPPSRRSPEEERNAFEKRDVSSEDWPCIRSKKEERSEERRVGKEYRGRG